MIGRWLLCKVYHVNVEVLLKGLTSIKKAINLLVQSSIDVHNLIMETEVLWTLKIKVKQISKDIKNASIDVLFVFDKFYSSWDRKTKQE